MVHIDAVPQRSPHELKNTPPAQVWKADAKLAGIADWDSLSIERQLEHISTLVNNELSKWFDSFQPPKDAPRVERSIAELLHDVATTIADPEVRGRFTASNLSERELVGALQYVSGAVRENFLHEIMGRIHGSPEVRTFWVEKLNNALAFSSVDERLRLLEHALAQITDPCDSDIAASILQSASSLNELGTLIRAAGENRLLRIHCPAVNELLALSSLGEHLRGLSIPAAPDESADPIVIQATVDFIHGELISARDSIVASPYHESTAAQEFLRTVSYNIEYIEGRFPTLASSAEQAQFAAMMVEKLELEFRFGITLTHEDAGPRITMGPGGIEIGRSPGAHWTLAEVRQARAALERLPEGLVLMTPLLREIQRVDSLGDGVLGQRFPDGLIRLSNYGIGHPVIEAIYPGLSSLEVTLVHEIGHGVQLGSFDAHVQQADGRPVSLDPGDPRYDFAEFMKVSGWELIAPERFEIVELGLAVQLDGEELPVGVPVMHHGKSIVLTLNQGLLFSYDAHAPFSLVRYSRTNPWEDWAEAFCDYFLTPERLIRFAPQKYVFLEQEFHRYEGREDLKNLVAQNLERRNRREKTGENYPRIAAKDGASKSAIGSMNSLRPE